MEVTSVELAPARALPRSRIAAQVLFALALTALLRMPAFSWSVISDDEGIYDAMAQVVNSGGVMYRDAVDHKPPGIVYLYAAVERLGGPHASTALRLGLVHFLGLLFALLTVLGLTLLARELLRRELWWLPGLLYGVASCAKCAFDGLAVNGELLMNLPTVLAVYALLRAGRAEKDERFFWDLLAGALVAVAGLFKWQALVVGLAFPFFAVRGEASGFFARTLRRGPSWLLGLALPLLASGAFFFSRGVLPEALRWGGLFNLRYISDGAAGWGWALKRLGLQLGSVVVPSAVLYLAGLRALGKQLRKGAHGLPGIWVWSVLSLGCVAIGGRFFGHYFLQAELPLCLLAAEPISRWFARAPRLTAAAVAIPAVAFFILGLAPKVTRALFDPHEPDWASIARAVAQEGGAHESLFVWGNVPPLYPLSNLPMGTRFSFCNYLTGLSPGTPSEYDARTQTRGTAEAWPLLLEDLEQRKPRLILDTAAADWKGYGKYPIARYPAFAAYVAAHYRPAETIDGAVLLRRVD